MKARSVIVVGAGIGGITAAIHLARSGRQVTVVEKNAHPGGRCDRFSREGHHFDTGPTLFIMPLLYEAEFRALGCSIREHLELQRVDPTYKLVFENGSHLALTSDMASMEAQMESIEPGSFRSFLRYLQEGEQHYRLVLENLVNHDFRRFSEILDLHNLPLFYQLKPLVSHYKNMSAYFHEPRLKSAFTFQDMYTGLSPFEAPATFSMMPYAELAHGVWYPKGGMYRIVEVLMELAYRAGVEFQFNAPVEQIDIRSNQVRGVCLAGGAHLEAEVVLANADLPYVYGQLLPPGKADGSFTRKHFSASAFSFFWGLDRQYPSLSPHMLFLPDDYRETFSNGERGQVLPGNPIVYLHTPAQIDPSMAPRGQDTLTAVIPVGHMGSNSGQNWGILRDQARQHVFRCLRKVGVTDLEAHIKFEETYTPLSWAKRYNLVKGSTHGLSHRLTQMAYFRPSNRHSRYKNLYFVGASTHPGTGIPTAMVSGRLVAKRIGDELPITCRG
jgi:phytoene desaturase